MSVVVVKGLRRFPTQSVMHVSCCSCPGRLTVTQNGIARVVLGGHW